MNICLKIYLIITSIIGTITLISIILGLIYMIITSIRESRAMKKQATEFKDAIAKSGLGSKLNRPLTDDEKELLKKTGYLEFTEKLDMETLNVTKETKTKNE